MEFDSVRLYKLDYNNMLKLLLLWKLCTYKKYRDIIINDETFQNYIDKYAKKMKYEPETYEDGLKMVLLGVIPLNSNKKLNKYNIIYFDKFDMSKYAAIMKFFLNKKEYARYLKEGWEHGDDDVDIFYHNKVKTTIIWDELDEFDILEDEPEFKKISKWVHDIQVM